MVQQLKERAKNYDTVTELAPDSHVTSHMDKVSAEAVLHEGGQRGELVQVARPTLHCYGNQVQTNGHELLGVMPVCVVWREGGYII